MAPRVGEDERPTSTSWQRRYRSHRPVAVSERSTASRAPLRENESTTRKDIGAGGGWAFSRLIFQGRGQDCAPAVQLDQRSRVVESDELIGELVCCLAAVSEEENRPERGSAGYDPSSLGEDEVMVDVVAPAGRLGLMMDTHPTGGAPYVCEVKDTSPVKDKVRLEDRFVKVDDEDVADMTAVDLARLLAKKSRQPERRISVARKKLENSEGF